MSDADNPDDYAEPDEEFTSNINWLSRRRTPGLGLGKSYGGDRDLYSVLGYDRDPTASDYRHKYDRQDIARTIVNAPASTAWRSAPEISDDTDDDTETQFEQGIQTLFDEKRLLHYWERADKVSGIGRYGVMVIGFAEDIDEQDLAMPVDADALPDDPAEAIAYFATFDETRVEVDIEPDPTSERYGLPRSYNIQFDSGKMQTREEVHWTRVIHIAEGLLENEVYGTPRLQAVYNRLEDLEKVVGGAAEMTWRGADRKFLANADTDKRLTNADEMQQQIEDMIHGLNSLAFARNVELDVIDGEVVDPTGLVDTIMKMIAGETGIPQRILTGSERGELASTQDRATFYGRMSERREQFCEPSIVRATLDRLIDLGVVEQPRSGDYLVEWNPLFELSEIEMAELMNQKASALKNAAPMGDPGQLATVEEIRSQIFDWHPERGAEVDESELSAPGEIDPLPEETPDIEEAFDDLAENARTDIARNGR